MNIKQRLTLFALACGAGISLVAAADEPAPPPKDNNKPAAPAEKKPDIVTPATRVPVKGKTSSDDPAVELPEMTVTEKVKPPRTQTEMERYRLPQTTESTWSHGINLRSNTGGVFDWELTGSVIDFGKDTIRAPTVDPTLAFSSDAPGRITSLTGSGWHTVDVKGIWRPR